MICEKVPVPHVSVSCVGNPYVEISYVKRFQFHMCKFHMWKFHMWKGSNSMCNFHNMCKFHMCKFHMWKGSNFICEKFSYEIFVKVVVVSGGLFCSFYSCPFLSTKYDLVTSAMLFTVAGIQIPASAALWRTLSPDFSGSKALECRS